MEKVIALEDSVVFDHPVIGFADEGFQDHGGDISVIHRAQRISNVMQ